MHPRFNRLSIPLALLVSGLAWINLGSGATAQVIFASAPTQIPATGSQTENVDFADVDHDGDWDATLADGGDTSQDQNRIYINRGGLQGATVGFYQDQTATRLPVVNEDGRDIEFVDFDNDGDADLYTSSTAQLVVQGNRWWTNKGGKQGPVSQLGFYQDDTAIRWVGLAGAGSSIAPSQVLANGSFIDWSCDCDFADLDNDGDMDLFHSTYGGAFGGQVPSRVFLNDNDGHFSEFNPSGFQLSGSGIVNGNPGLWCQGTQTANTTNTTGTQCDVASTPLDIDLMDMDGDFDIDVLHGARQEAPRIFRNLLAENGSLAFRDTTGSSWPAGYFSGGDNYEQEMGDMDNDGDVDVYGLNYPGLSDAVYNNISTAGNIVVANMQTLASSGNDDNEGDFADVDNDGDLDLIVAAFIGQNRLYRNLYAGGAPGSFSYTYQDPSGLTNSRALDSDNADVDNDGDYDNMTAEDANQNERLHINTGNLGDTKAARIPNTVTLGNNTAAAAVRIARAQVYDNGNYYNTWYNTTKVKLTVGGCALPELTAQSSQGQIFRASVPGNLVGAVTYQWTSKDEHNNTGSSTVKSYTGSSGLAYATNFGAGSAGATLPPAGTVVPTIQALSVPFAGTTLYLAGKNAPAGAPSWIFVENLPEGSAPNAVPFVCNFNILFSGGIVITSKFGLADANGCLVFPIPLSSNLPPGTKGYAQFFVLDGTGGNFLSSSAGLDLTSQ